MPGSMRSTFNGWRKCSDFIKLFASIWLYANATLRNVFHLDSTISCIPVNHICKRCNKPVKNIALFLCIMKFYQERLFLCFPRTRWSFQENNKLNVKKPIEMKYFFSNMQAIAFWNYYFSILATMFWR